MRFLRKNYQKQEHQWWGGAKIFCTLYDVWMRVDLNLYSMLHLSQGFLWVSFFTIFSGLSLSLYVSVFLCLTVFVCLLTGSHWYPLIQDKVLLVLLYFWLSPKQCIPLFLSQKVKSLAKITPAFTITSKTSTHIKTVKVLKPITCVKKSIIQELYNWGKH